MKLLTVLLACVLIVGCFTEEVRELNSPPDPIPTPAVTALPTPELESKAVATLRAEAYNHGLKWSISCHDSSNGVEYCAWAVQTDKFGGYIEDGAKPSWFNYRLPTQDAAAEWLTKAIKGQPNHYPKHRPKEEQEPAYCNSQIGGERP